MNIFGIHFHSFRVVKDTGVHRYLECECGKRDIVRYRGGGHQPISWSDEQGKPPSGGSGAKKAA